MVEADLGVKIANFIGRVLIADIRRAPGEVQLSARTDAQEVELRRLHRLMLWILDNPAQDLSTRALSEHAHLSIRSLHRHFLSAAGVTPAKFVERSRVQSAQRLLARTDQSLAEIAAACGYGSQASMQRAFTRQLGVSPATYRSRSRAIAENGH
jgi:transcriptional regulator GlxA family with amidase domain